MAQLSDIYRPSLSLLTDLYQLTMGYGYWKTGAAEQEAVFHLFFRTSPFKGGYAVNAGLQNVIDFLLDFSFSKEDTDYLATLTGNDDLPLFEEGYLSYLHEMEFSCTVDAIPEGTVVFPHEPLLRVRGPLYQCQLIETALLNMVNFQTLIATKAARICQAARGEPVLEFGLRRAQGIDGGLSASRAACIGGCVATSNVLAGKLYGLPVKGTHAHSWVMCFDTELASFEAYAAAMPNNCVFLVDTYDTLEGVRNAVTVGKKLREKGYEMVGIRLDSGDLAYLSIGARTILDDAGFQKAAIVASNDLNENTIASLKEQGATIGVWGVGTQLATGGDQSALGGVYKLAAVRDQDGEWQHKIKLSEQAIKVSNPGILQVRRYIENGEACADMIYDELTGPGEVMIDPADATRRRKLPDISLSEDLLVRVIDNGKVVAEPETTLSIRDRAQTQIALFHSGIKRMLNPHQYPVGLEQNLFELKSRLIMKARGG